MRSSARWVIASVTLYVGVQWAAASAQTVVANLTSPVNGAVDVGPGQPFQWSAVGGAEAYYLYVGSTPGAKDMIDTGELQTTGFLPAFLPSSSTLFVRLWTKYGGIWRYQDSSFSTQPLLATITSPGNGQSDVALATTFAWTAVPNVQAYYLYVGTTVGANNIVNTGETLNTSWMATALPAQQTLYARMWAKVGNVWRYTDSTFTTRSVIASLTSPTDGQSNVGLTTTFTWNTIANADRYYLYVGTTAGATDIVNSGEITATQYVRQNLPENRTFYVRLWTHVGGIWRYRDTTFSTQSVTASLLNPVDGAATVALPVTFQWSAVPDVQAYYLYVGTAVGLKDVVDTGETTQTSWTTTLPGASTLWARLWTKLGGTWRYVDARFGTQPVTAVLSYPGNGFGDVALDVTAQWNPVNGADRYSLVIGTSPGAGDVFQSGEITATSVAVSSLPEEQTLYARLATRHNGVWRYVDSTFTTGIRVAKFLNPLVGVVNVDPGLAFEWMPALDAEAYVLYIGTTWGGSDLVHTGEIMSTSYVPGALPNDRVLYARIWTKTAGIFRYRDTVFSVGAGTPAAMLFPADGSTGVDAGQPFAWQQVDLATAYRLQIGTTPGGDDLHDSGAIFSTKRFVRGLPLGVTLYGRLSTEIPGEWRFTDFTFSAASDDPSATAIVDAALWQTGRIRAMADANNQATPWSELGRTLPATQFPLAVCGDYARVLLTALAQLNTGADSRELDIAFTIGTLDSHVLVEFLRPDTATWMLLDPTFGLTARNAADSTSASWADVRTATLTENWTAIAYQFLTADGDAYVRGYFMDYPLLYLNHVPILGSPASPAAYIQEVSLPVGSTSTTYVIQCQTGSQTAAVINGQTTTVACGTSDSLSSAFVATSIEAPSGSDFKVFKVRRFVF